MKTTKRILSLLLCLAMVIGFIPTFTLPARAAEQKTAVMTSSELGISNAVEFKGWTSTDGAISLTVEGSGTTAKYYSSGYALRFYTGNVIKIAPSAGYKIVSIAFTTPGSSYDIDNETIGNATNPSANNLTPETGTSPITVTVGSSQVRIKTMTVTYEVAGGNVCEHPADKLTPNQGDKDQHWDVCECGAILNKEKHTYTDGVCECGKEQPAASNFVLVTNASALAAGDKVIIVAKDSNYAMSTTQNDKNRGQIGIVKDGDVIAVEENSTVQILTLEAGTADGTFAFNTGSGYLYAASGSANQLKTKDTLDGKGSWNISITEGVASVVAADTSVRGTMQYNSSNSLFACYSSASQAAVSIYKLTTGEICKHEDKTYTSSNDTHHIVTCANPDCAQEIGSELHDTTGANGVCSKCGATPDLVKLTVEQAYALEKGASFAETVTLTGVINKIKVENDGAITATIVVAGMEDKPIMCYKLVATEGNDPTTLAVTDTITVTGTIKNYNGTIEFDKGTLDSIQAHPHDNEWKLTDEDRKHYEECKICGATTEPADHVDADSNNVCDDCGAPCGCEHADVTIEHKDGKHIVTCNNTECDYVDDTTYTVTIAFDDEGHWDVCTCGYNTEANKVAHTMEGYGCTGCDYTIPVETPTAGGTFIKVETAPTDWTGVYLIVYTDEEGNSYAFDGSLEVLDVANDYKAVTINGNTIEVDENFFFVIEAVNGGYSIKSSSGLYIGQTANDNGMLSNKNTAYAHTISMGENGELSIVSGTTSLRFNAASNQMRFRYYKSGQEAVTLYKWVDCEHEYRADCDDSCEICGAIREPLAEHNYLKIQVQEGQHHVYCDDCGFGHGNIENCTYGEGVYTDPTVYADGYWTYTCTVCGATKTETEEGTQLTAVAQNGEKLYATLAEAVGDAAEGDVIELLSDASGAGIVIDKSVIIALGGHTYTVSGPTVGSAGTETNGFQILSGNDVTISNGTIDTNDDNCKILIQNYASLLLMNVTVDGTGSANMKYVLSNNSGTTCLEGAVINAPDGAVAFDVYDYSAAGYSTPAVSVVNSFDRETVINGKVEVDSNVALKVYGGTFNGEIVAESADSMNVFDGIFAAAVPEEWCADGFIPTVDEDGNFTVKEGAFIAQVGDVKYESLSEALAEAESGDVVTLLADATIEANTTLAAGVTYEIPAGLTLTVAAGVTVDAADTATLNCAGTIVVAGKADISNLKYGDTFGAKGGKLTITATGEVVMLNEWATVWSPITDKNLGGMLLNCETGAKATCGTNSWTLAAEGWKHDEHSYTSEQTKDPTCTEAGETTYTCTAPGCGHSYTEPVAMLPHTNDKYEDNGDGTHKLVCSVCGAVEIASADHTYDNAQDTTCNDCGAVRVVGPVYDANVNFSNLTMNMESSLKLSFQIDPNDIKGVADYYAILYKAGGYEEKDVTVRINKDQMVNTYFAEFPMVIACDMGEKIEATLYVVDADGTVRYGKTISYSILDYLNMMMGYYENIAKDPSNAGYEAACKWMQLAVETLNYGAAAQTEFGYKTDALVNAGLTNEQKAFALAENPKPEYRCDFGSDNRSKEIVYTSLTLNLQDRVYGMILIDTANLKTAEKEALYAEVRDPETGALVQKITFAEMEAGGGSQYWIPISAITPANMTKIYTVQVFAGEAALSTLANYSIDSYASLYGDAVPVVTMAALRYGAAAANALAK